jgi:hypothetical protein
MCDPSVVADDWISKGCHIYVGEVELVLRPDHLGGVIFKPFFSSTSAADAQRAIKHARENCLPNEDVRNRWLDSVRRARLHLLSTPAGPTELAMARGAELHFLDIALQQYGAKK